MGGVRNVPGDWYIKGAGCGPPVLYHWSASPLTTACFTALDNLRHMTQDICSGTSLLMFVLALHLPHAYYFNLVETDGADRRPSNPCLSRSDSPAISATAITAGTYFKQSRSTVRFRAADTQRSSTSTKCRCGTRTRWRPFSSWVFVIFPPFLIFLSGN